MAKCIFDEKAPTKGYRRCKIRRQYKTCKCTDFYDYHCKYFKMNFWNRLMYWLGEKFYR